jgi:hypothetical protein
MPDITMPLFVFARRRDIEIEAGLTLAGQLIVDIPKRKKLKQCYQQMIVEIAHRLTAEAQSGRMPDDAIVYGWAGGRGRPANAVDTDDDALMTRWAQESTVIGVRVDPRNDGLVRIDSDMRRQMGLCS